MKSSIWRGVALTAALVSLSRSAAAAGLSGSHASMVRQHAAAVALDYTFVGTPSQVRQLVADGRLEPVTAGADLALSGVSFPYARAEVHLFVQRLAAQYHEATGERMVVTSLVRPVDEQPTNASALSVHPAGMAVDLRVPAAAAPRAWLERSLLSLEKAGVIDVTREHHPSHYHVAVFPEAYRAYAVRTAPAEAAPLAAPLAAPPTAVPNAAIAPAAAAAPSVVLAAPRGTSHALVALAMLLTAVPLAAAAVAHRHTPSEV